MRKETKGIIASLAVVLSLSVASSAFAAKDEMGTGIPQFGTYTGGSTIVWSLENPKINFPSGCTRIEMKRAYLGEDYKLMLGILTAAKLSGRTVRFYSHADRGCQFDYVEMN